MDSKKRTTEKVKVNLPPEPDRCVTEMSCQFQRENTPSILLNVLRPCLRIGPTRNSTVCSSKKVIFRNINMRRYALTDDEMLWKKVPRSLNRIEINGRYIRDFSKREIVLGNLCRPNSTHDENDTVSTVAMNARSSDVKHSITSEYSQNEFPRPIREAKSRIPVRRDFIRQPNQHQQEVLFGQVQNRVIPPHRTERQLELNRVRNINNHPTRCGSSLEDYRTNRPSAEDQRRNEYFADDCRRNGKSAENVRKSRKRKSLTVVTKVKDLSENGKINTKIATVPSDESGNLGLPCTNQASCSFADIGTNDNTQNRTGCPRRNLNGHSPFDTSDDEMTALLDSVSELADRLNNENDSKDTQTLRSPRSEESLEQMIKEILDDVTPPQSYRSKDNSRNPDRIQVKGRRSVQQVNSTDDQLSIHNGEGHIKGDNSTTLGLGLKEERQNYQSDSAGEELQGININSPQEQLSKGKRLLGGQRLRSFPRQGQNDCLDVQNEVHTQTSTKLKRGQRCLSFVSRKFSSFKLRIKSFICSSNSVE